MISYTCVKVLLQQKEDYSKKQYSKSIVWKKQYKYKGYNVNGQVRMYQGGKSEVFVIESLEDLSKIVWFLGIFYLTCFYIISPLTTYLS